MKLIVKNKLVSWGGSSTVKDENGQDVFKVKGKAFSPTNKKFIKNLDGKTLYTVRNKWFNFFTHSSFIYDANKHKIAKVKNRSFKTGYDVIGYSDEISLEGWSVTGFSVLKNGTKIGEVKCNLLDVRDNFTLTIDDEQNPAFLVALIIAIDNINDKSKKK